MSAEPVVETRRGRVRGRARSGVRRHLGIPFAAPPVGPRRFAAPAPPEPWSGVREAAAFGPAPPQRIDDLSLRLGLLVQHPQSEDCLHLNVYAPDAASDGPWPVMVWIHGGAFLTGTAAGPVYDPSRLVREGGVVVVTLNYRVGALGFLAVGAANCGLQDQVAALRWVRDEIAGFGGDPGRVTVFGESAGAGSIVALLAMPSARGLFERAIVQSAAPEGMLSAQEAATRADLFAAAAGVEADDLAGLRRLDPEEILAAQCQCQEPGPRRIGMFFAPVVDGEVLPESPMQAVAAGRADAVALVIGTTAQEMQLYHLSSSFPRLPDAALPHAMATRLPGSPEQALSAAQALMQHYADPGLEGVDRFFAAETDASLFVPASRLAELHARRRAATFMYRFCWPSPMAEGRLGACHALDVPFTLGSLDRVPEFAGKGEGPERVSRAMRAAWVAFAHTGDPACPEVGSWPGYRVPERRTLCIDDPCRVVAAPDEARRSAWAHARGEASEFD